MSDNWSLDQARETYALAHWSDGYVDLAEDGRLCMRPAGAEGPAVALDDVVTKARASGLRLPLLARFPDILGHRLARLKTAFASAIERSGYAGGYTAIYPIKVNQQRGVVAELVASGGEGFGLEAGSKPELMAVLALAAPGSTVICNGYKDREYIRLALIGRKLGLRVVIVIEKPSELDHVIAEAAALDVKPLLGVRVRLATLGAGKWQNTGGAKGKFGLNPGQILALVERARAAGLLDCLELLHFHMGSQISNLRDIAGGMREAARYLVELRRLGVPLAVVDVGGGLGVDYEGSRSRGACSINYGMEEYAATVVSALDQACRAHGIAAPDILTEAGRAMTAHHAVLLVDVGEVEPVPQGRVAAAAADEPAPLVALRELHAALTDKPPLEIYHEALFHLGEGQNLFALGQMNLAERACLDDLFHAIAGGLRTRLRGREGRAHRQALDELDEKLIDKYFLNFSVFESIPDVWAIDQVFPIAPLTRLDQRPDRRAVLVDLTCDSDGRIDQYVGRDGLDVSLPLHAPEAGKPYRLGIFLVGAYQETLGDIHNLFGDTDAVDVRLVGAGCALSAERRGDTADLMLDYVGYDLAAMRASYAARIDAAGIRGDAADTLRDALEAGLTAYTYLGNAE